MIIDLSDDYTTNCLRSGNHATNKETDTPCGGWVNPGVHVRHCQCLCHEIKREPYYGPAYERAMASAKNGYYDRPRPGRADI